MIIEKQIELRDFILAHQPYFDKGFADARLVVDAERNGIFFVDAQGEHESALIFDYNSFYIRRIGATVPKGGSYASGLILETPTRLVAQASDVDQYKFADCLVSTIATKCGSFDFKSIEFNPQTILRNEGLGPNASKAVLSRLRNKQFLQLDFSIFETYSPTDVVNCSCNPCKTC